MCAQTCTYTHKERGEGRERERQRGERDGGSLQNEPQGWEQLLPLSWLPTVCKRVLAATAVRLPPFCHRHQTRFKLNK